MWSANWVDLGSNRSLPEQLWKIGLQNSNF